MNSVEKIDVKYIGDLDYSLIFHFKEGKREFTKNVLSAFENINQRDKFAENVGQWRAIISHWEIGIDKIISEDLGNPIVDHLLISTKGETIGLFDFVRHISNLN